MFNLLRRRVRRKHNNKNKYNIDAAQSSDDNVPKYSTKTQTNDESKITNHGEHYRQFLEQDEYAAIVAANVGASITDKKAKTTRNVKNEKEAAAVDLEIDGSTTKKSGINAGKIYFENARDKRRQLKKFENDEQQQQALHKQQAHLPESDNFASTTTFRLKVDDDHHKQQEKPYVNEEEEVADIAENEQSQRQEPNRQKVEDMSYDRSACGFSHNEQAERQRRDLTIGEYDEILLNRTNRSTTPTKTAAAANKYKLNIDAFETINHSENRNLITTKTTTTTNVEDVNYKFSNNNNKSEIITTDQKSKINNEVKYRNLDKTSRNEAKRQSRLSFTLAGINFGRKKEVDDRAKNDQDNNNCVESIEVAAEPVVHYQTNINESNKSKPVSNTKLGPLQKSREYLNNLFMARGRQHNRHQRHQQQQQSQQQVSKQQQGKNDTPTGSGLGGGGSGHVSDKTKLLTMTSSSKNVQDNAVESTAIPLHLNATDSTNSYRIPLAKNSTKNFQTEASAHTYRERSHLLRSNSARQGREHSLSPQLSKKRSRSVTFSDIDHIIEDGREIWLNKNFEQFSRSVNIERNSGNLANNTANVNFAKESNNNAVNTHGVVSAEKAGSATTSAFEDKNHYFSQTSSYMINECKEQNNKNFNNCNNNNKQIDNTDDANIYNKLNKIGNQSNTTITMGQKNTKTETPTREYRESSVSSTASDRIKKVSFADFPETASSPINIHLPTITVADYSEAFSSAPTTPSEQEVFYDFENSDKSNDRINKMTVENFNEHDANCYVGAAATNISMNDQYNNNNNNKWQTPNSASLSQSQMRNNYVKLEDVREEDENEEADNNEEVEVDAESEEEESVSEERQKRPRHLDNELYNSAERSPLKSSDTTLSGSPSDSGIGTDSQPATPSNVKNRNSPTSFYQNKQQIRQQIKQQYGFMSFARDGSSTDCEETLLPCDDIDIDFADDYGSNDRLVCIESISLPDVVVESTAATASSTTLSSAFSSTSSEHIINISGAASNSMGNVHFIPIHVEGASSSGNNATSKRRSIDDSVIGNGTIEITEDASVINGFVNDNRHAEKLK